MFVCVTCTTAKCVLSVIPPRDPIHSLFSVFPSLPLLPFIPCINTNPVSQPVVTFITPPEAPFAGGTLSLTCRTELTPTVDSGVVVVATWKKAGEDVSSDDHVTISPSTESSSGVYDSVLTVEPVSLTVDGVLYSCEVLVVSSPSSQYVLPATSSATGQVTLQSKLRIQCSQYVSVSIHHNLSSNHRCRVKRSCVK